MKSFSKMTDEELKQYITRSQSKIFELQKKIIDARTEQNKRKEN